MSGHGIITSKCGSGIELFTELPLSLLQKLLEDVLDCVKSVLEAGTR